MATTIKASVYSKIYWLESTSLSEHQRNDYHHSFVYHYRQGLNFKRLKHALQATVNTNYNLRSNFIENKGELYQVIHDHVDATLECYRADNRRKHNAILQVQKNKPFDMSNMPLFRFILIKNKYDSSFTLVLVLHHIILDGTQISGLMQSISNNYINPADLNKTDKKEIYQLKKYIKWEQQNIDKADIQYWFTKLKGYSLHCNLPYQKTAIDQTKSKSVAKVFQLDNELYQGLTALSVKYGLSIFNIMKTIISILIARYTNQEKVVISYPFNTRGKQFKNIKGAFVNTLPYPFESKGNFIESVKNHNKDTLLSRHRYISAFDLMTYLVEYKEKFNVSIAQTNLGLSGPKLNGLPICSSSICITDKELSFFYEDNGNDLKYIICTLDRLFDKRLLNNISRHFKNVLMQVIENPKIELSTLSCLDKDEYKKIVYQWNATKGDYSYNKCVHELFEQQVKKTPNRPAVIFEDKKLTYKALNCKANQLAHYLQKLGVVPDTLVAISVKRSFDMVIGLLGILKAGGAYVPLDPNYPKARLQTILHDTKAPVLLTQEGLTERLEYPGKIAYLDLDWKKIVKCSNKTPTTFVLPKNLAYVIYTSGSTGQPKGVMIEHRSVCNQLLATNAACKMSANDRLLQNASFNFDVSVWEIFSPLIAGSSTVLLQPDEHKDSKKLTEVMIREHVTIMSCVPAMLNLLVEEKDFKKTKLRVVATGYERLSTMLNDKLCKVSNAQLYNFYGPTETCIDVTLWICPRYYKGSFFPIGQPHPNIQAYILDNYMQPSPIYVPGQLYIGGIGLARGYLNQEKLTQKRFISNPFDQTHNAKLYKTGDLARYLPDGNIEFLDRIDNQIKIRGFRVEIGEIETNLIKHKAVKQAAVIALGDSNNKRLVAYCIIDKTIEITTGQLRDFLKLRLPDYMLPSLFVTLECLPLTASGKIDRITLADMKTSALPSNQAFVRPQSEKEHILSQIWSAVLGLEKVGIHDNFFNIGGDSIISIQIAAKATAMGLDITPNILFQHQTIAELAQVAERGLTIEAKQGLVSGNVLLTPIQHWFFEQNLKDQHHWNQARLLEVSNDLDETHIKQAVEKLIEHHDTLRSRFKSKQLGWQQEIIFSETAKVFVTVDLSKIAVKKIPQKLSTISTKWQASLSLANGPIIRAVFFILPDTMPNRLLLAIHHTVVDGVSWRIILEDLQRACQQLQAQQQVILPIKTTSYQRWAKELTTYAKSKALTAQWGYWLNVSKAAKTTRLPLLQNDVNLNIAANEQHHEVGLSPKETQALLQQVPEAYHTQINDILLLALTKTMVTWSGENTLFLSLEGHGREEISPVVDVSRTVGWFTSFFPVLLTLDLETDLGMQIKSIKEQLRQIPKKGLGYSVLRYLSRDIRANELESVANAGINFNYLGQFDQMLGRQNRHRTKKSALFTIAKESPGHCYSLKARQAHPIDINGFIERQRLSIIWTYSPHAIKTKTLIGLADQFIVHLKEIIKHCKRQDAGGYTASDFPQSGFNQTTLDTFISQWTRSFSGPMLPAHRNVASIYPISPLQQGLVFHSLAQPDEGIYCVQCIINLTGKLNKRALKAACQQIVYQHPILRTLFVNLDQDNPLQIVLREVNVPWFELDLAKDKPRAQVRKLKTYLQKDRAKGFDFDQAPIMRFHLVMLSSTSYQLIWTYHHSLLDGWSIAILKQQLWEIYQAQYQSRTITLENSRPYQDYITWLLAQDRKASAAYWRQSLHGFTVPTQLSVDRRTNGRRDKHKQSSKLLSKALTQKLYQFARKHQLTTNTVMLGVWSLLLCRYSGDEEVLFGVTTAGRPGELVGVEKMVGLFLNTLPLRIKVLGKAPLIEWLKALQAQQIKIQDHGSLSLTEIQKLSEVPGNTPLFESLFVFENYPVRKLNNAEPIGRSRQLQLQGDDAYEKTNYPLSIVIDAHENLKICLRYQQARLADNIIDNMLGHIEQIIKVFVENGECKLADFDILTKAEKETLLVKWNATEKAYPKDKCIHQLFEEQAKRIPNNIAVIFDDQKLTYKALNSKANQLAHYLKKLGVKPETLVAICVERSLEMVIGILGILKAGGAYVPLDPNYPQARLQFILKDTKAPTLLTQKDLIENLGYSGKIIYLHHDWQKIASCSKKVPVSNVMPDNLAYVIYTSGSTGSPKGACCRHRGVVDRLCWVQSTVGMKKSDTILQKTSLSFDVSVREIFWSLSIGAKLVLLPPKLQKDPKCLVSAVIKHKISVIHFVPSMLQMFINENGINFCNSLRAVISGGETLTKALQQSFFSRLGSSALYNFYGPTEATINASYWQCNPDDIFQTIPIGKPIANTQLYILDHYLNLVPVGVNGQLHIGGLGLAHGYLNRSKLTKEKFIQNPFNTDPNSRLYKTGDLARYLPDGNIEFLGRIDNQVKIRGFRIELGEIEMNLLKHEAVKEAAVIACEDNAGNKRLVAYCVTDKQIEITADQLRDFLKAKLPDYMQPSLFVTLEHLPLTANGKVDRNALVNLKTSGLASSQEFVLPHSQKEIILAQIWSAVLGLDSVGIHDNFFEIGGDSIISIQIVAKAAALGLKITPRDMFEHQTIADLAQVVERGPNIDAEQGLVSGRVPLTPIQHRFFEQNLKHQHHWNQARLLKVSRNLDKNLLKKAVEKLIEHHDALRLRFKLGESGWQQENNKTATNKVFIEINLSQTATTQLDNKISHATARYQASLNLTDGPIVKAVFFNLPDKMSNLLLIAIHHLAVDGVSWRILLEDLQTACEQLLARQQIALQAKTSSYQHWAKELQTYAKSQSCAAEWDYWLGVTKVTKTTQLPLKQNSKTSNTIANTKHYDVSLSAKETQALLQQVPDAYHTQINDVLLLALTKSMTTWSGNNTLLLDLEGHGREQISPGVDVSRTVGWFTTVFPVLLTLEDQNNLGTQIKSIKEQLRQIPNKGIGYGVLRYLSQDKSANKLKSVVDTEISFNYLGQFDQVFGKINKQSVKKSALFSTVNENPGDSHSPKATRTHLIDINAFVQEQQLNVNWTYSPQAIEPETLIVLADQFIMHLREIIKHCQRQEAGGYTPSDFPQSGLNQAALDILLSQKAGELAGLTLPAHRNIASIYPISPLQQGLVFHSLTEPASGVYCVQSIFNLEGKLNKQAVKAAWEQVIHHHPILRTLFVNLDQENPLQIVLKEVDIPWFELNLTGINPNTQKKKLNAYLKKDRAKGFDFAKAPIMRFHFVTFGRESYQLIWTYHHSLVDGWSVAIIKQQFWTALQAHSKNQTVELENSRPYQDYIIWLLKQDSKASAAYWQQKLKGFSAPTPLGIDQHHSDEKGGYGQSSKLLSKALTHKLYQFARQHQLTANTVMLGVWSLLLSRYSGEEEVLFGVTTAGRPGDLVGIENMVGLFLNTLPMRLKVPGKAKLIKWLKTLQVQQVTMQNHGSLSLTQIQKLSAVPGDRPLFENLFVFENYPVRDLTDTQAVEKVHSLRLKEGSTHEKANYPLGVIIIPDECVHINIKYEKARFLDKIVVNMLGHIEAIIKNFVEGDERKLADYSILTKAEKEMLLVKWNATETAYPRNKCIHQLFEEQVEKTPGNTAIVFKDQKLSYKALNSKANQLAHYLQRLGVKPETLVAICVERSFEMVIGFLGILKAGGVYVPLDPEYPKTRLQLILKDTKVPILLTQQGLLGPIDYTGKVIFLDHDCQKIKKCSNKATILDIMPDNLAYVIYTSGSTGKPKGVCIEHRGLVNCAYEQKRILNLRPTDRILQFSSISFDASIAEILLAILSGCQLCIADEKIKLSPEDLSVFINNNKITTLHLTPAMLQLLRPNEVKFIKYVITMGDGCSASLTAKWCDKVKFYNFYGPTEASIWSSYKYFTTQDISPTIGRPIANTKIYILNAAKEPSAVGFAGEIHISGAGLARGYLNNDKLTQEKFIQNPFSTNPNSRLYKTGDLARYMPDGDIEFIGRIDNQVKLRGFRIELSEIESTLVKHRHVKQCVVIVQGESNHKQLVAYYVPRKYKRSKKQSDMDELLRTYLEEKLPRYMLPSFIVAIKKIPLTGTGKVDRRSLARLELEHKVNVHHYIGNIEFDLLNIWKEVLKLEFIAVTDNFFSIGGHSLLAIKLINKINKHFHADCPISWIFLHKTIQTQAKILRMNNNSLTKYNPVIQFHKSHSAPKLFMVHPGLTGAEAYVNLAHLLKKDVTLYGINSFNLYSNQPMKETIEEMASYYIQQIRTIKQAGPYYLGGWSFGGLVAYEMACQLKREGELIRNIYLIDSFVNTIDQGGVSFDVDYQSLLESLPDDYKQFLHELPENAMNKFLQVLKQHHILNRHYTLTDYDGPITLLRATQTREGHIPNVLDDNNWQQYSQQLSIINFDANHFTIMEGEHLERIAQIIKNDIDSNK